jgi:carbonic anhydrase
MAVVWCGVLGILIQVGWNKWAAGRINIPAVLPAVLFATLASIPFVMPRTNLTAIGAHVQHVWGVFGSGEWMNNLGVLFLTAVGLALVASAETLLTARATDVLAEQKGIESKSDLNRELIGQGVGNTLCGVLGGLPITGVIVRSSANISFGARTKYSAILHGLWALVFVLALPFVIEKIPASVLASVLVLTGLKLLAPEKVLQTFRANFNDGLIWLATFAGILATDLLRGLGIGLSYVILNKFWIFVKANYLSKNRKEKLFVETSNN